MKLYFIDHINSIWRFSRALKYKLYGQIGKDVCTVPSLEYITLKVFSNSHLLLLIFQKEKSFLIGFKWPTRDVQSSWQLSQVPPVSCLFYYMFDRYVWNLWIKVARSQKFIINLVYTALVEPKFLAIVFYTNSYEIGFKPQHNSISDIILKERRKCLRSAFWCYFKRQLDSYKQTKSNSVNRKKLIF